MPSVTNTAPSLATATPPGWDSSPRASSVRDPPLTSSRTAGGNVPPGDVVRNGLDLPARDGDGIAVRAHAEEVIAGGIGDEHVVVRKWRDPVRVGLAGVRLSGRGRDVDVERVDVDRLVGENVEDRLRRRARGGLAVQDAVGPDAPTGAIGRGGDVDQRDRIGDRRGGTVAAARPVVLEDRTRRAGPALPDEDRVATSEDALRRVQAVQKDVQVALRGDGRRRGQADQEDASREQAGRTTTAHG